MIKTIVYVYDQAYISGGAAKIAIKAAVALKQRGYRVIYFAAADPIDEDLVNAGIEVVCIGGEHIAKTKNIKSLLNGIWNSYSKQKFDELLSSLDANTTIVHVHGWTKILSSSIFDVCKKYNIKTFITLHEYFTICQNGGLYNYKKGEICSCKPGSIKCYLCNCDKRNYFQKVYRNVRQLFTEKALNRCKPNVIYITEFSRNILKPLIHFSSNEFYVENHVEIACGEKIDVKNNQAYLFMGRMSGEKAPELFCEAVSKANVKGIVIGDGPQLKELKAKYPDITFTGWLNSSEMESYIKDARCLIVTSKWYETMGLTIIEMQSRGIPCIVPNRCAGKDYIKDKMTGFIYEIGNLNDLIEKIGLTRDNKLIEQVSNSFYEEFNAERFSMEKHIDNLIHIYNQ